MQKLRENHETIQQLSSQLQQMQEQMNSMNDSGDFQDVPSNCSGRLSHVSSQLAMIPSSRALPSRDKRLPLDTWNQSGLQENGFGNQFSTIESQLTCNLKMTKTRLEGILGILKPHRSSQRLWTWTARVSSAIKTWLATMHAWRCRLQRLIASREPTILNLVRG